MYKNFRNGSPCRPKISNVWHVSASKKLWTITHVSLQHRLQPTYIHAIFPAPGGHLCSGRHQDEGVNIERLPSALHGLVRAGARVPSSGKIACRKCTWHAQSLRSYVRHSCDQSQPQHLRLHVICSLTNSLLLIPLACAHTIRASRSSQHHLVSTYT